VLRKIVRAVLGAQLRLQHMLVADAFGKAGGGRLDVHAVQHLMEEQAVDAAPQPAQLERRRVPELGDGENAGGEAAAACIGAVVAMRVEDYYPGGKRWWVRLHEKGGKRHEMPAHHKLEQFLDEYLAAAGIRDNGKTPLFRSAVGRTGRLTENAMHRVDAYQMIRRRTPPKRVSRSSSAATSSARPVSPPTSRPAARSKTPRPWPRTKARA
jgi:hypothetical protein